jgi:hypothetical protein
MTAFKKLLLFSNRIAPELALEFIDLVQAYAAEEHQATIKLFEEIEAIKRPYEVVAIAGTAETLLNDVTDTNVGEIKYGDTVECIAVCSAPLDCDDDPTFYKGYRIEVEDVFEDYIYLSQGIHSRYKKSHFRKVSTPLSNPLNSVEGC